MKNNLGFAYKFSLALLVLLSFFRFKIASAITFDNPLGEDVKEIQVVASKIYRGVIPFAMAAVAFMFLWGAANILFAEGNEEKYLKGRKTLVYAVVGLVVLLLSLGIAAVITNVLKG